MALPHIQNSQAGINLFDPVHTNIFEILFTLPESLKNAGFTTEDELLLTEHVTKISGLDALNNAPGVQQQKFMGTDRSYIVPKLDQTHAELEVTFTLNLRNETDNYIYKIFRAWAALGYDVNSGARSLKKDYCAEWMKVSVANRKGDIYHEIIFRDVMINGGLTGSLGEYNYDTGDAAELTVKFVSDWWEEKMI